jgi:hypothetical protein
MAQPPRTTTPPPHPQQRPPAPPPQQPPRQPAQQPQTQHPNVDVVKTGGGQFNIHGVETPPPSNMAPPAFQVGGISDNTKAEMMAGKRMLDQYSHRNDAELTAGQNAAKPYAEQAALKQQAARSPQHQQQPPEESEEYDGE